MVSANLKVRQGYFSLLAQTIKIAEALVHGDMIVTTEATESGLNGRRVHLPLISSAVKSAWKNALGVFD